MTATTKQKARLLDLTTGVLELVRDGKRDIGSVSSVLQLIKDDPDFAEYLVKKSNGGGWPGGVRPCELLKRLEKNGFRDGIDY